jgi:hypothetical protein
MALWCVVAKIPVKTHSNQSWIQSTPERAEIHNLRGLIPVNNEINAGTH